MSRVGVRPEELTRPGDMVWGDKHPHVGGLLASLPFGIITSITRHWPGQASNLAREKLTLSEAKRSWWWHVEENRPACPALL